MVVPSRQFGNLLIAEGAETLLLFPEVEEFPFPFEGVHHLHAKALLEVHFPFGIIRISSVLDFDVSLNGDTFRLEQANGWHDPILSKDFSTEHPVLPFNGLEVFLLDPLFGFLWVSAFCPVPQHAKDGVVHLGEGLRTDNMPMIVRPSPNFRVQLGDEVSSHCLFVVLYHFSDALQERLYALLRGGDQQLSVVFAQVLSEKVEAVLNMRDESLFW